MNEMRLLAVFLLVGPTTGRTKYGDRKLHQVALALVGAQWADVGDIIGQHGTFNGSPSGDSRHNSVPRITGWLRLTTD